MEFPYRIQDQGIHISVLIQLLWKLQLITGGFPAQYGNIRSGILDVKTIDGSRDRFTAK
jgi:hypothetical protein